MRFSCDMIEAVVHCDFFSHAAVLYHFRLRHSPFGCCEATHSSFGAEDQGRRNAIARSVIQIINMVTFFHKICDKTETRTHTVKTLSKHHRNCWLHRSCWCLSISKAMNTFWLWLQRRHWLGNVCADVIRVCVCWIQEKRNVSMTKWLQKVCSWRFVVEAESWDTCWDLL